MEDTFREGEEKEEQQDKEKIKEEDNAIEMSEDFDGQMHDGDEREEGRSDRWRRHSAGFTLDLDFPLIGSSLLFQAKTTTTRPRRTRRRTSWTRRWETWETVRRTRWTRECGGTRRTRRTRRPVRRRSQERAWTR